MKLAFLKKARVVLAILFFVFTLFLFIDFAGWITTRLFKSVLYLQFFPSLLKFAEVVSMASAGFIFILLITLLFGRVYCSAICPLGIFQDIFSWISKIIKLKKRYRYLKPQNLVRYAILLLALATPIVLDSQFFINLLDPYSLFGKISSSIIRPAVYGINNLANNILNKFDIYSLYPVTVNRIPLISIAFAGLFMAFIVTMAALKGRWYCNVICPVGSLLGLCSKISLFRISIDEKECTACGLCAMKCKSGCIDFRNRKVDFSRCVACYNCIGACPEEGITYRFRLEGNIPEKAADQPVPGAQPRRTFLKTLVAGAAGAGTLAIADKVFASEQKTVSTNPVSPPGSVSYWHYTAHCTACHLCVSACPTRVLQPSFMEFGLTGLFQPRMDYRTDYCNFECVKCSEICPTGAILPLTKEQKATVQIGVSKFIKNFCVVVKNHTACAACSEHCPTKAVEMTPYLDNLKIPKVDEKICVGCGACEYACPAKPEKAIYVEANLYHHKALKPLKKIEETKKESKPTEDFPF